MHILEGWQFSGRLLKKEKKLRFAVLRLGALAVLLAALRCAAAICVLLLRRAQPVDLLTTEASLWRPVQTIASVICCVIWYWCSWQVLLQCAKAAEMAAKRRFSRWKMLALALESLLIRTVLLQSVPLCLFGAYRLSYAGAHQTEAALWLFGGGQLVVLAVLCLLGYVYVSLGLCCMPFVYFSDPSCSFWLAPKRAMDAMYGGRKELLLMLVWYGVMMLPVVTIPWVLPRACTAVSTFFCIRVRLTEKISFDPE